MLIGIAAYMYFNDTYCCVDRDSEVRVFYYYYVTTQYVIKTSYFRTPPVASVANGVARLTMPVAVKSTSELFWRKVQI